MHEEEKSESIDKDSKSAYLNYWNITEILSNAAACAIFAFLGTALLFLLRYFTEYRIVIIVPAFIFIVMLFRNNIIEKVFFWKSHYSFLKLVDSINSILKVIFIMLLVTFVDVSLSTNFFIIKNADALFFSILSLYFPINIAFTDSLSVKGKIKIEFEQAKMHLNTWSLRQKWLKKIFQRLENKLKVGYIKIPSDSIVSNINRKTPEEIEALLKNIEEWTLGNEQDDRIFIYLEEIINKDDIKPIQKIPITNRISKISPEHIKYLVWLIIALVIILFRPEWVDIMIQNYPK